MPRSFFITSTGTGIGKTLLTAILCHQLTRAGHDVQALKPIMTGFSYDDPHSDSALILRSLGKLVTHEAIDAISPWRFRAPLSPHMAAWREGGVPALSDVAAFCRQAASRGGITLAESAGGVMAPLDDHHTMRDFCAALGWPAILVAGSYLGSISHTLTALEALAHVPVRAIVVSESETSAVPLADTVRSIRLFARGDIPVYTLPRLPPSERPWEDAPSLVELCQE